ncbi:MAG: hypothetical protein P8Y45_00140 [Exilibacterium sp.]
MKNRFTRSVFWAVEVVRKKEVVGKSAAGHKLNRQLARGKAYSKGEVVVLMLLEKCL